MMTSKYIKKYIYDIKKHHPNFFSIIEPYYDYLSSDKVIELIANLYNALTLNANLSKKFFGNFIKCCLFGIKNNEIKLFSMCSNSLTSNPLILRDKIQYKKITELKKLFEDISIKLKVNIRYICILPDYEPKYNSVDFDIAWNNNVKQIYKISDVTTYRLSKITKKPYDNFKAQILSDANLKLDLLKNIDYYTNNKFIVLGFNADENFQKTQIMNYSVIGLMLEDIMPYAILADIQKKNFPFEQKFYNFSRKEKLPIIFYGQNLLNN